METWSEFKSYIESTYKVAEQDENSMKLLFSTVDERSQIVLIWKHMFGESEWIEIESPIAKVGEVDAMRVLRKVEELICGGLSIAADHFTLKHSIPIANLDPNEFEEPLMAIVAAADHLEKELVGSDRF